MLNLKDYKVSDKFDGLELQLVAGKKVKFIFGFTDNEFYDPVFHITRIVFDDDTEMSVAGEHDIAYVESYEHDFDKKINDLHCLDNPEDCKNEDEE